MSWVQNVDHLHSVEVDHDSATGTTGNVLYLVSLKSGLCACRGVCVFNSVCVCVHVCVCVWIVRVEVTTPFH